MKRSHKGKKPPRRLVPCMPPLLEQEKKPIGGDTSHKSFSGSSCENIIKSYFLSKRINVAEPIVDDGVDLLIEKPEEGWVKGQIKKVVYKNKLDWEMKKRGVECYRSRFDFNFQNNIESGGKQRKFGEIDYFYHVLVTNYRQLIWETPVDLVPLKEDGTFVHNRSLVLDRDSWVRRESSVDYSKLLVYTQYDPIIFETYPDFFLKKKQNTLDDFF